MAEVKELDYGLISEPLKTKEIVILIPTEQKSHPVGSDCNWANLTQDIHVVSATSNPFCITRISPLSYY